MLVAQSVDVVVGQRALSNEQRFRRGENSVRRIMREHVQRGQIDILIGVQRQGVHDQPGEFVPKTVVIHQMIVAFLVGERVVILEEVTGHTGDVVMGRQTENVRT